MVRKKRNSIRQQKHEKTDDLILHGHPDYNGETPLSNPEQELFCVIFTTNTLPNYWANGQNSYMFAYGHTQKIEAIETEIAACRELMGQPKSKRKGKSLKDLEREIYAKQKEIDRITRVCRSAAPRLLASVDVKKRCNHLLDTLATHTIVDRELTYLIQQRDNVQVKLGAIAHHDKREQRIREKVDVKHEFAPINGIDYVRPAKK